MHLLHLFINRESRNLYDVALRAREIAKGEKHKEAATKRREVKASGDHFEQQMDRAILWAFLRFVGIGAAIAFVLVTMFFLIF